MTPTLNRQQQYALAAWRRTVGFSPAPVTIDGGNYSGVFEDLTTEEVNILGGVADSGGFRVMVGIDVLNEAPARFTPISGQGKDYQVLSSVLRNGVIHEISAGDPTAEEE